VVEEEGRTAEGDRTVVVELELDSNDKNDLENLQKQCSGHGHHAEAESADRVTADTALRWTSERICHLRH
jgi:hypothetical protein